MMFGSALPVDAVTKTPAFTKRFYPGQSRGRILLDVLRYFLFVVGQTMPDVGVAAVISIPKNESPVTVSGETFGCVWCRRNNPGSSPKRRDIIVVIGSVEMEGQADLFEIVGAVNPVGGFFGFAQGGQEQSRQNRNNRDHHQQFNQRKSVSQVCFHYLDVNR